MVGIHKDVRVALAADDIVLFQRLYLEEYKEQVVRDGMTMLIWAARFDKPLCLQFLVDKNANLKAKESGGATALYWAACASSPKCVRILTKALHLRDMRSEIDARIDNGSTPLMGACFVSSYECAKLLLDAGANVNAVNNHGDSALMFATSEGDAMVKLLLEHGAYPNSKNQKGCTPLSYARQRNNHAAGRLLEAATAAALKKSGPSQSPSSPSSSSLSKKQKLKTEVVPVVKEQVIKTSPKPAVPIYPKQEFQQRSSSQKIPSSSKLSSSASSTSTAVVAAAITNKPKQSNSVAKYIRKPLLKALNKDDGVKMAKMVKVNDLESTDAAGMTMLINAARNNRPACLQVLIDKHANLNAQESAGATALYCAAQEGHRECVEKLVQAHANIDLATKSGNTPLMVASFKNQFDCAKMLINAGAMVNATNTYGSTALMFAVLSCQDGTMTQLLLSHGADWRLQDADGSTALDEAKSQNNKASVFLLQAATQISQNQQTSNTDTAIKSRLSTTTTAATTSTNKKRTRAELNAADFDQQLLADSAEQPYAPRAQQKRRLDGDLNFAAADVFAHVEALVAAERKSLEVDKLRLEKVRKEMEARLDKEHKMLLSELRFEQTRLDKERTSMYKELRVERDRVEAHWQTVQQVVRTLAEERKTLAQESAQLASDRIEFERQKLSQERIALRDGDVPGSPVTCTQLIEMKGHHEENTHADAINLIDEGTSASMPPLTKLSK